MRLKQELSEMIQVCITETLRRSNNFIVGQQGPGKDLNEHGPRQKKKKKNLLIANKGGDPVMKKVSCSRP